MKRYYNSLQKDDDGQNVDLTPLIDMVFILLIFFIVTTVFVKDKAMDIDRPSQASEGKVSRSSLLVVLTANGQIRAGGEIVSINSLRSWVSNRLSSDEMPVVILADRQANVENLAEIMDECKLAGAKKISLATEQK
ncbi:MAG: biopolymer transporter ExbD [Lentisphaeraceae bacterium]|nr:biopolymer transporter ExbD [Lentisphaeraceae bacterium]